MKNSNMKSKRIRPIDRREVNRIVQKTEKKKQEVKFLDTTISAFGPGSGGMIANVSDPPQGDAQSQRVGDSLEIRSITFSYQSTQVNSDIYSDTRIICFQWFPNTIFSSPTLASILYNTSAIGLWSGLTYQYRDQFHVHFDQVLSQSGTTVSVSGTSNIAIHNKRVTGFRKKIVFSPAATNAENHIFFLFVSDSAATPFPLANFQCRLLYTDA